MISSYPIRPKLAVVVAVVAAVAIMVAGGCGGDSDPSRMSGEQAATFTRRLLEQHLDEVDNRTVLVDDVQCVSTADRGRYTCVIRSTESGREVTTAGTLNCDRSGCVWRGQNAGG